MSSLDSLHLSLSQLQDIQSALTERIRMGLNTEGAEIRALTSYFGAPDRSLEGSALVVDTGGTNMRAAVLRLQAGRAEVVAGPVRQVLPMRQGQSLSADEFFHAQASLAAQLPEARGLPVGYCFSYPSENSPERDSRLLRWTKGIDVQDVVGTLVGSQLGAALEKVGLTPGPVRVLNDTVASMLGGAWANHDVPSERCIGLIVGTGNNMAGFFGADQSNKIPEEFPGKMAINLESGNFDPPHLTEWDTACDEASDNPGYQRFEKAVSGFYLPFVFARLMPELTDFDPAAGTGALVQLRQSGPERAKQVAGLLLQRSADLVAASLAGVLALYDPASVAAGVLAEGGFFWNDPLYAPRVNETLHRLVGPERQARILKTEEANLIGSAVAALSA
jgi:hexokinase